MQKKKKKKKSVYEIYVAINQLSKDILCILLFVHKI